jgi:hypothetical protein
VLIGGTCALIGAASAPADVMPNNPSCTTAGRTVLQRLERVRERLRELEPVAPAENVLPQKLAQWYNWPNWNNYWSDWSDWNNGWFNY